MLEFKEKFSISYYKVMLSHIKKAKLNFISFNESYINHKSIIMRHDVDFCPLRALEIARIEKELKVKSTFFFMVNNKFYNINSIEHKKALLEIDYLGHNIGLHFDASFCINEESMQILCKKEIKAIESILEKKINIVSFHRPSKFMQSTGKKIAGLNHTYMKKFTKNIIYCSDSQGIWRFKNPIDIINENINSKKLVIQLLTHPIWWTTPEKLSPGEKVDYHLKNLNIYLKKEAAKNCIPYASFLKSKLHKNLE